MMSFVVVEKKDKLPVLESDVVLASTYFKDKVIVPYLKSFSNASSPFQFFSMTACESIELENNYRGGVPSSEFDQ